MGLKLCFIVLVLVVVLVLGPKSEIGKRPRTTTRLRSRAASAGQARTSTIGDSDGARVCDVCDPQHSRADQPRPNEEQFLGETLAHIKVAASALANTGWETELIVCDNNSTDRTADIARAAGANVVFEPVNQISSARNSGAAVATGDWLVFVDADSHPSAGVFADMAKEIRSGNCIAGGATIRWDQKLFIIELLTPLVNLGYRWRRMLSGAFIFIETAAFRSLGGFSNEAFGGEDVELARRLKHPARTTRKRFVILHRHPVVTSARRMRLYTTRQQIGQFRLLYYILFDPHHATKDRQAARIWYDGRRW